MVNGIPQLKPATGLWIQNSSQNLDYTLTVNLLDLGDSEKNKQAIASAYKSEYRDLINSAYELSIKDGYAAPVVADVEMIGRG
jgi:putative aldouronate transport system substrate-binding protein